MGVCCIVFYIDGMLFEFFMNFLNIEKNKILRIIFFKFHVFFAFYAISNILILQKIEILKSAPSLTVYMGGQWESISNIVLYSLVLIFDLKHVKCGGGGGGA